MLLLMSLFILLFTLSCTKQASMLNQPKKTLSGLQIEACNAADKAQTCNSRLAEINIVSKEDCCNILGKCC